MPNQETLIQSNAFVKLFSQGQRIAFQKSVKANPIFFSYPFQACPQDCQFLVLNPFKPEATERNIDNILYRQGITVEMDCVSLQTQRDWFKAVLGNATVSNFSGNKSIHQHIVFINPLSQAEESQIIELCKKAFPFADWQVLSDRARLCRTPGALRDNGKEQTIEFIGEKKDYDNVLKTLQSYTQSVKETPNQANKFTTKFWKEREKGKIYSQEETLKTVKEIMENLLECGYELETFLKKALLEMPGVMPEDLQKMEQEIEDKRLAKATKEMSQEQKKISKDTKLQTVKSWKLESSERLANQWHGFYENQGIHNIKKTRNGWNAGYTSGEHKNKTGGFHFRNDNGYFVDFYSKEQGFPQKYLTQTLGISETEAWQKIAEFAGVQAIDKCKYCQAEIQWKEVNGKSQAVNMDGTAHNCKAKTPALPFCFWYETKEQELKIEQAKLYAYITSKGIGKILIDDKGLDRVLVRIEKNVVREIDISYIQQLVSEEIKGLPDNISSNKNKQDLTELFIKGINVYITNEKLNWIKFKEIEFLQDTKDKAFFFFKNGFVEVTKDKTVLKDYSQLQGYIWKSQIINHEIEILQNPQDENLQKSPFFRFIENICSIKENIGKKLDTQRHNSLIATIGYLLHNYKTTANKFAVILTEANVTEDPQGRTGKGLLMQAVNKLRKVTVIDGKNFSFDSQFAFQNVELDTQILFLDDVSKHFNFQRLFSAITEGLSFEKKHRDRVNLPPEKSPKIVLSTNFSVQGNSASDRGRKYEMELLCYYSDKFKPVDEFGKEFFHTWESNEWNNFYNFMLNCVKWYLTCGRIPEYNSETVKEKKLLNATCGEFIDFADKIEKNVRQSVNDTYQQYLEYTGVEKKELSKIKFNKWISTYCEFRKLQYKKESQWGNNKAVRYFILEKKES